MRRSGWATAVTVVASLSLGIAACGGSSNGGNKGNEGTKSKPAQANSTPKAGGKLTVLWSNDTDYIDCGATYYQMGTFLCNATQKALYGYKPDNATTLVPDLASAAPEVSADGKTVTVKIKSGVKYSPPYQDHTVTSADVKYAVERGFFNTVNNGYAGAYFGDIDGAKPGVPPGTTIKGIETPDPQTIVFHLTKGTGGLYAAGALGMPLTAPVPEAYAAPFDKKNPSTYGNNQLATGPYMIANDATGKATGYVPSREIHLVRNPSWDKSLDFKPAYLDEIDNLEGNDDTNIASRKIITGQSMINGDFSPPPEILKQVSTKQKDQLELVPSGGGRWVAMNMKVPPFDNINIRKAVIAGFDRNAMRLTRGGELIGAMPTHYLVPGMAGFDQAGGLKGFGLDFMNTTGAPNPALAAEYFKKAGMASGKYEGTDELLMVGDNSGVAAKAAEVAKTNFENLGFKVRLRLVQHNIMYTKYCNEPAAKVAICPNVGWLKDFADAQTLLDPTFNGKNIIPQNNSNWSQLDDPAVNAAMEKAELLTAPAERAQAWADVDKLITNAAPAIPWVWDNDPEIESANVAGVPSLNSGVWDLTYTSLK
jgi:peptide/nickel transport system substrate-binding protein